jgi:hypothetical protein
MQALSGRFAALAILGVVVLARCSDAPRRAQGFQRLHFAGRMLETTMKGNAVAMVVLEDRSFRQAFREFETELDLAKAAATDADRPVIAAYEDVRTEAKRALEFRTKEVNTLSKYNRTVMEMDSSQRGIMEDKIQDEIKPYYLAVRAALDRAEGLLN